MRHGKYQKAVTFSYDDGVLQDRQLVEIFNTYGMKSTFNLNTGIQSRESTFEIEGKPVMRMNREEIGDLYRGHEVAVHGLTHAAPVGMSREELEEEFGRDMENIERQYGCRPVGMAYAYGAYDRATVDFLQEKGILYGRTVETTHAFTLPANPLLLQATCHHNDDKLFELAEQFLAAQPAQNESMLFYVWGHSYEFYVRDNWSRIEKFCRLVGGQDDIFYGTNRECLELFECI
jgi:peptidoglycan/xylan/chitin deacetylase (PgdA/CDA1 family)